MIDRARGRGAGWLAAAVIGTSLAAGCATDLTVDDAPDAGAGGKVAPEVAQAVDDGAEPTALVVLDVAQAEAMAPALLDGTHLAAVAPALAATAVDDDDARARDIETRATLYQAIGQTLTADLGSDLAVTAAYRHLPVLTVRVGSRDALAALADRPEVAAIHEDRLHEPSLTQSLALIRQPAVAAAGRTGAGTTVAVLDTGLDYTRSAFGSCPSPGASGCKVAFAADFGISDGSLDETGHGTNVAAIVLGVAPGARVAGLDVFNGGTAPSSAILAGIDWSIQNRATYNIVAMNLSLGSGLFTASCGNDVFASALANARAAGIAPVVASGNNGATSAIAAPACAPAAISVGAAYDASLGGISFGSCTDATTAADRVTCFSNSAPFLSVLAPGALVTAAGITMAGTSQAAPHVAGAVAVLRAARPSEGVEAAIARLVGTGPAITDARNGVTTRRLDLAAALGIPSAPDTTAPTGRIELPAATRSATVTASLSATDAVGVTSMCLSNSTSCSAWIPYEATRSWSLTSTDGTKTVRVKFRDAAGNVSAVASDTVILDTRAPTEGTLTAAPRDGAIRVSWTGYSDSGSGITSYVLVSAPTAAPTSCTTGTVRYTGAGSSVEVTGLTNGAAVGFRLCAVDAVGNTSAGKTVVARPAPELSPPVGTVRINEGAPVTGQTTARLAIAATDASGVAAMCVSSTTSCTAWVPYATQLSWPLGRTSGVATVSVWFRDTWGNTSVNPATAAITVDTAAPRMGTLSAVASNGSISLSWNAATDTGSGVASYRLVYAPTTAPASCLTGTLLHSGTARAFTHTGRAAGKHAYRLCATDNVGNAATGSTKSVTIR
jgi:subtilisin family serine protease